HHLRTVSARLSWYQRNSAGPMRARAPLIGHRSYPSTETLPARFAERREQLPRASRHEIDVRRRLEKEEALFLKSTDGVGRQRRSAQRFAMFLAGRHDPGDGGVQFRMILFAAQAK